MDEAGQSSLTGKKRRHLPDWLSICKVQKNDGEEVLNRNTANGLGDGEDDNNPSKGKSKEDRRCSAAAEFQQRLEQYLPEMTFSGKLTYSSNINDCNVLCEMIECEYRDVGGVVGFDMEWPVSYRRGYQDPTAVLQLCTGPDSCYVFHLSTMGCIPPLLNKLLKDENIKKVGVAIGSDLWKLERDYNIQVLSIIKNSMVDLGQFANTVLKTSENWSLDGLVRHLFKHKIDKNPQIRKSNWSHYPLSEEQKKYAATDAYVSYQIYKKLMDISKKS